jgi:hypothetical protein
MSVSTVCIGASQEMFNKLDRCFFCMLEFNHTQKRMRQQGGVGWVGGGGVTKVVITIRCMQIPQICLFSTEESTSAIFAQAK